MPSNQTDIYNTFISALTVVTLLLGVFAFSIIYHLRRKRNQMKAKSYQDECAIEVNKKQIATDLHDDFGSLLNGLKLSLRELSVSQPGNVLLENSTVLLENSVDRLREVAFNLLPRELETEGLNAALEMLVERMNVTDNLQVHYTPSFDGRLFQIEKAMVVYRVIQELTTNAVKHSAASKIEIGIAAKANRLLVEIRDNGSGFDYSAALKKKKSSGLKNIQSRLDLLDAIVIVESSTRMGTHYFINIPLKQLTNGRES